MRDGTQARSCVESERRNAVSCSAGGGDVAAAERDVAVGARVGGGVGVGVGARVGVGTSVGVGDGCAVAVDAGIRGACVGDRVGGSAGEEPVGCAICVSAGPHPAMKIARIINAMADSAFMLVLCDSSQLFQAGG